MKLTGFLCFMACLTFLCTRAPGGIRESTFYYLPLLSVKGVPFQWGAASNECRRRGYIKNDCSQEQVLLNPKLHTVVCPKVGRLFSEFISRFQCQCLGSGEAWSQEAREISDGETFTLSRRAFLLSLPLFLAGYQPAARGELYVDPGERALQGALNALEVLSNLSTSLQSLKDDSEPPPDIQVSCTILNRVRVELQSTLPDLELDYGVDREEIAELLDNLAFAESVLGGREFTKKARVGSSSTSDLDRAIKLLKIARNQVDGILQDIPQDTLQLAQLARGVRPMA